MFDWLKKLIGKENIIGDYKLSKVKFERTNTSLFNLLGIKKAPGTIEELNNKLTSLEYFEKIYYIENDVVYLCRKGLDKEIISVEIVKKDMENLNEKTAIYSKEEFENFFSDYEFGFTYKNFFKDIEEFKEYGIVIQIPKKS